MDTEHDGQKLQYGAESYSLAPRIPRKPLPSRNNDESSHPLISMDTDDSIRDVSSDSRSLFKTTATNSFYSAAPRSQAARPLKQRFSPLQNWWLLEIVAALISVFAMVSLLGVLYGYNGRVAQQLPLGITLNGLVAVLATICRVSLLVPVASGISQSKWLWFSPNRASSNGKRLEDLETFDSASRGSWGSLKLLWKLKARHMASFGAVITILTLAVDTFVQQVLSTQNNIIVVPSSSLQTQLNIPRSENYTISTNADNESERIPDWPTYAAIYNGIIAPTISYLPVTCATGNCTWPIVPSLGICGSCTPLNWTKTGNCTSDSSGFDSTPVLCNYTLPDGQYISVSQGDPVNMFQVMNTKGTFYNTSSTSISYITNFEAIGMPFELRFWNESLLSAQECALWYCIQAYNISVTSNVLNQFANDTWSTIIPLPANGISGATQITFTDIPPHMNVNPKSTYFVNFLSYLAAQNGLTPIFVGVAEAGAEGIEYTSEFVEAIWSSWGDINHLVSNLALSMTNNIRQTSPADPSPMYAGTAYLEKTFVQVRWLWLILPIVLVVCSVVFLISSMIQTKGNMVYAWKSSVLALLFSDIDQKVKFAAQNGMNRPDGLAKAVGESRVVLRESNGFWEFRDMTLRP